MRKLDILIPRYKESFDVLKPLLDSIAIQQNVDMDDIGVIITDDGEMERLDESLFSEYPFCIEYLQMEHGGVSKCRNYCLDHSRAEYVMFCDIDDMFYNACGLWIVFREIENGGFDSLVSVFIEESRNPIDGDIVYINHDMDSTFVHGKIHRRKYLTKNRIRFNDDLTIHEDSFFNILCQKLANNLKYCQNPFYLWKWRDESVCRHDPKYILKTYNNMLDSNTALVKEFMGRKRKDEAVFYSVSMIYDAYLTMNKKEWIDQENQEYRRNTETRFAKYYKEFKSLFESIDEQARSQIIIGIKNRFFQEGVLMESITFEDWIKHIESLAD